MAGDSLTEIRLFIGDYDVVFDVQPESEQIIDNPCHGCMILDNDDCYDCWGNFNGAVFNECINLPVFYQAVSITKITRKPATLNYPCGSMGEEIEQ